jgi:hypothetical protein
VDDWPAVPRGDSLDNADRDALAVGGPGMLALRAERPSEILLVEILDQ